ncbi:39S ribosomal protein L46, mitochondrial-like [Acropora millepora]|uniref:39S ribosomal protein L46, mitochondrial-like n=1 Tax=Acropora millepora TaxID=45264 RepID=UPI001CF4DCF4|nr:39S ribosomal protein L46, mitochondrial-like [Acropora millepora]
MAASRGRFMEKLPVFVRGLYGTTARRTALFAVCAHWRNYSSVQPHTKGSRIFSAVCVQRLPIITKTKTDLEIAYEELQEKLEWEHSALSEDEVQWDTIMQRKEKIKDEDNEESLAIGAFESERKEFEEEQEEEWKTFVPAPRNTEADELNDLKSLQRKLQETLVLLVKKEKDSPSWEPPLAEVMFDTSETLQQVASRGLCQTCGTELHVQFLSNAPIAVMKNHNNKSNKVFFYKVNYLTGCVSLSEDYCDHVWVTKEEMEDLVDPEYYKSLKRFLS